MVGKRLKQCWRCAVKPIRPSSVVARAVAGQARTKITPRKRVTTENFGFDRARLGAIQTLSRLQVLLLPLLGRARQLTQLLLEQLDSILIFGAAILGLFVQAVQTEAVGQRFWFFLVLFRSKVRK